MPNPVNQIISDDEFLYRGIISNNWDFENNRPSSATFKDSNGVSVDRDNGRIDEHCIYLLKQRKDYFGVCKVKTASVREIGAIVKYLPTDDNIYHSEIHDSMEQPSLRGSKPKKIRDIAEVVFKK